MHATFCISCHLHVLSSPLEVKESVFLKALQQKKGTDTLKRVQRRVTKVIRGTKYMSYKERMGLLSCKKKGLRKESCFYL